MTTDRMYDIVVYGATGYTGRLVCDYLHSQYGVGEEVNWAMAGRSRDKLEQLRDDLGLPLGLPLIIADAGDAQSINDMVASTRVVITTVGPYQLYGSDLVAACAASGTDYVDLCGEPAWMHDMIASHRAAAEASGARIVFSCGFDSVPFDLGVVFLQRKAVENCGVPFTRVKGRVKAMKGGFSGGTLASLKATMAAAAKDAGVTRVMMTPFALTEGVTGADQPTGAAPVFDEDFNSWSAPFVMATINTKNVHRSNFLLGHPWGKDFVYDEMLLTGPGDKGEAAAKAVAADRSMAASTLKPGDGPSKEERDSGFYEVLFAGSNADGNRMVVSVKGDKDPGYGSTSRMIAESAVCLLKNPHAASGGIWTAGAALGELLIERLQANAGLRFTQL